MSHKRVDGSSGFEGISRRDFILGSASTCAILGTGAFGLLSCSRATSSSEIVALPPLPYKEDALEPYISRTTIGYHYGKHHRAYVDKTNELIKGSSLDGLPLNEIVKLTAGAVDKTAIFNNAAQAWNHDFYWKSMVPKGPKPGEDIAKRIDASFGGFDNFKIEFLNSAVTLFGSGWTWLVLDGNRLSIQQSFNADNPISHGKTPLLTIDVWEHAYYLDYQNRRKDYLSAIIDNLLNWDFAASNLPKS